MWKRIPRGWRLAIVAVGLVYAALTIRMFFVLPLLGFVLVGAFIWAGWSAFALVTALEQLRSRRRTLAVNAPSDPRSIDRAPRDPR